MSDKDLLVVISEMLRKQDQQAEKLDEHSRILNQHSEILNEHTEILNEHTGILKNHTEILNKQIDISNKQTALITETNSNLREFMNISIQQFQEQQKFNEKFLGKLDEISKKP
ncbi:MAG: hypothetical protein JWR09_2352 [Mucilaginibacter sp.]|nr:hypothetical protein [Mucilaginibacter sp.]